ncbi:MULTISPECIES: hypothetical protein [Acinetobacter]|jgi:hypothetical protein|uniref:hypothetical protein n=1 Tax=Acinetobacter TaxID=469 RepID=UPI002FE2296D
MTFEIHAPTKTITFPSGKKIHFSGLDQIHFDGLNSTKIYLYQENKVLNTFSVEEISRSLAQELINKFHLHVRFS